MSQERTQPNYSAIEYALLANVTAQEVAYDAAALAVGGSCSACSRILDAKKQELRKRSAAERQEKRP